MRNWRRGATLQGSWTRFVRRATSPYGRWDVVFIGPIWVWLCLLAVLVSPDGFIPGKLAVSVLLGAGSVALAVPVLIRFGRWPAQEMVIWYGQVRAARDAARKSGHVKPDARSEVDDRAGELLDAGRYAEVKDVLAEPRTMPGHDVRALADIMETGSFDQAAYSAAVVELAAPDERPTGRPGWRSWRHSPNSGRVET